MPGEWEGGGQGGIRYYLQTSYHEVKYPLDWSYVCPLPCINCEFVYVFLMCIFAGFKRVILCSRWKSFRTPKTSLNKKYKVGQS